MLGRNSDTLVSLTTDHKPTDFSEHRRIEAAGGYVYDGRVNGSLALSRAFGDYNYKLNKQLPPSKQQVIACPDVTNEIMGSEDFLIICCDGIFEALTNSEVIEFVSAKMKETDDLALIASQLIDESLIKGTVFCFEKYDQLILIDRIT